MSVVPALWQRPAEHAPLAADAEVDVAIVGGGMTGLSVALHLRRLRRDWQVLVLESRRIGFGASGRASGFLAPEAPTWPRHFRRRGVAGVERLRRWGELAQSLLIAAIDEHRLNAGLVRSGVVFLAVDEKDEARLRERRNAYRQLGVECDLWSGGELVERVGSRHYRAGLHHPGWALVDPGRLLSSLAALAAKSGVRVHEGTPVTRVVDGRPVVVECEAPARARVRARHAVLASNAYTPSLGFFRRKVLPIHLGAVLTAPLDAGQIAAGEWRTLPGRTEISHRHTLRLDDRDRVLLRGGARYLSRDRVVETLRRRDRERLLESLHRRHPELAGLECESAWSGAIGIVRSPLPLVGTYSAAGGLHYALGYNGYGLASAFLAGRLLARRLAGEPTRERDGESIEDLDPAGDLMTPVEDAGGLLREPLRSVVIKPLLALGRFR